MDVGPHPTRRFVMAIGVAALAIALAAPAVGAAPKNQLVSQSTGGATTWSDSETPDISADGRYVVFTSDDTHLVQPDQNGDRYDVFIRDLKKGKTKVLSKSSKGVLGNDDSYSPSISASGRFVVFASDADDLIGGKSISGTQIYLRDRLKGKTKLISKNRLTGKPGDGDSSHPVISADGAWIAYESWATNLSSKDERGHEQIFSTHRQSGVTFIRSKNNSGRPGNANSERPSISSNGRYIAFESEATDLLKKADGNGDAEDIFVRDTKRRRIELVSKSTGAKWANEDSADAAISGNGRFVVFESHASNLIKNDKNGKGCDDVYIRDRAKNTTKIVSVYPGGKQSNGDECIGDPDISADGRYVAWEDDGSRIAYDDTYPYDDVYIRDLKAKKTWRVSNRWNNQKAAGGSDPALSANGLYVAFEGDGDGLGKHDDNDQVDIYRTRTR